MLLNALGTRCKTIQSCSCSNTCRAEWNREKALNSNYKSNLFQSDPNEGFGRNAAPPKVSASFSGAACKEAILSDLMHIMQALTSCSLVVH